MKSNGSAKFMNVKLGQVTPTDKAKLLEWRNSLEVSKWMFSNHVISEEEHSAWFEQMLLSETTVYWKILMDSRAVGAVNLSKINLTDSSCRWAIYLGEASARGLGAAQAACLLSLNFAFETLDLRLVRCEAIAENVRAISLYEQVGFVSQPTDTEFVQRGESNLAIVKLEISDSAWKSGKDALHQILDEKGVSLDEQ